MVKGQMRMFLRHYYKLFICLGLLSILGAAGWWLYSALHFAEPVFCELSLANPFVERNSPFCQSEATRPTFSPLLDPDTGLELDDLAAWKRDVCLNLDLKDCQGDVDKLAEARRAHCGLALNLIGNYLDPKCAFTGDKRVLLSLGQSILEYYDKLLPLSFRTLQIWCQVQMGVRDEAQDLPKWQIAACSYVTHTEDLLKQLRILKDFRKDVVHPAQRTPLVDMERDLYSEGGVAYMQELLNCLPVDVHNRKVAVAASGCQIFTGALASLPPERRPASIIAMDINREYFLLAKCLKAKVPYMQDIHARLVYKAHTLDLRPGEADILFCVGTNHLGTSTLLLYPKVSPTYYNTRWLTNAYNSMSEGGRLVICDSFNNVPDNALVVELAESAGFRLEKDGMLPAADDQHPGFLALPGHDVDIFYLVFVK